MSLNILHINIRCWKTNRYLLLTELCNYSPDIILLNETSNTTLDIKIQGFRCLQKCNDHHAGVAILIKSSIQFHPIYTSDDHSIAAKIFTSMGPIIISTNYIPPRLGNYIPSITINKILNHNLPTIIASDFNAKHPFLHNTNRQGDHRGQILHSIAQNRNLQFIGPFFNTFQNHLFTSKPDVVLANRQLSLFHHHLSKGRCIGSDHFPILIKLNIQPIKILISPKNKADTLNIENFKNALTNDTFQELNNRPTTDIDQYTETLINNISNATTNNCQQTRTIPFKQYTPTPQIKLKLRQYQAAYNYHLIHNVPHINTINRYKQELINLIELHRTENWNTLVNLAAECWANPSKFWSHIHRLQDSNKRMNTHLTKITEYESDSEDELFGTVVTSHIADPQEKANFMSDTWKTVFTPHNDAVFNNANTRRVKRWYNNTKNQLAANNIINMNNLIDNHPLLRPITTDELQYSIKATKNKAPGPSGIKVTSIKNLPVNYTNAIKHLYNAIIASKYWPTLFKTSNMIFAPKPNKSPFDPLNYRPISLLELLAKILERIISNRLLLYLEYNNYLPQNQFGFRPGRSTQQSIFLINEAIKESRLQHRTILTATRDITKAFDSLWHEGLLYKIFHHLNLGLDFTSFIFNYINQRVVLPWFEDKRGTSFSPKSGVPQGSVLGPTLFLIFVHDLPAPLNNDTIIAQFADDVIHVIRSDCVSHNRARNAISKLKRELINTIEWEENWKIKTSYNKCAIGYTGTSIETLENLGGISIRGNPIQIKNNIKILGFTLNNFLTPSSQANSSKAKASYNLKKLQRFSNAPIKVKRYLYIALIRPLLEYPCHELSKCNITSMRKLQIIQNNAIRFIYNIRLTDHVRVDTLHHRAKLDPINVRLAKLSRKFLYKTKFLLTDNPNDPDNDNAPYFKLVIDFVPDNEPLRRRRISLVERLVRYIFNPGYERQLIICDLPKDMDNYALPAPTYR